MRAAVNKVPTRLSKKTKLIYFKVELEKIETEVRKQQAQIDCGIKAYLRAQGICSTKHSSQAAGLSEPSCNANISRSSALGPSSTPKDTSHLAKITEKDQTLFWDNNSCNKYRTFFTSCTPKTCKNEVYNSASTKLFPISNPLSEWDVEDARKGKGHCAPFPDYSMFKATATAVGFTDISSVAAICEYSNVSAVVEEAPDSSFDSSVSGPPAVLAVPPLPNDSTPLSIDDDPISIPHLLWPLVISHFLTVEAVPVTSMIDTSSFLILISAAMVDLYAFKMKPLKFLIHTHSAFNNIP
jgi:hypothetical protein